MRTKNKFRDLIIGTNKFVEDNSEFKRVLLFGQLNILLVFNLLLIIIISFLIENYALIPYFGGLIIVSVVAFTLNRLAYYKSARYLLLIIGNIAVAYFNAISPLVVGNSFYFVVCAIAAVALFSYRDKVHWIFFLCLTAFLFIYVHYSINIFDEGVFNTPKYFQLYYFINFFSASALSALMVYFLIRTAHGIEDDLIENQQLLQSSEERFRLAMYGINAGIWDWPDMAKPDFWWSPKCYDLLGYQYDEIPPHKTTFWNLLIHPEDLEQLNAGLFNHLRRRIPFSVEVRLKTKHAGYEWFLCTGQAQWDQDGKPLRMVGSILNIDEVKQKEYQILQQNQQLEKTNRELDRFVYSASHDLRAPLASILGLINLCQNEHSSAEVAKMLELMKGRVANLNQFIAEIIDYSKNARMEIKSEAISLKDLAMELFESVKYRKEAESIHFKSNIDTRLMISTDLSRLKIVLNNLLDNAVKYHDRSKKETYVQISAFKSLDKVIISVEDNGRGIPFDLQPKVFDMFYRASEDSKGSGLGLYIVKETVEKLGGAIKLKSGPGVGSTFTIELTQTAPVEEVLN
jgi:signal transduction histidine kinase